MRTFVCFLAALLAGCGVVMADAAPTAAPSNEQILSVMRRACDWQLANLPTRRINKKDTDDGWVRAVFYTGDMALYRATHDAKYLQAMEAIGQKNQWHPAPRFRFADDQAVGQMYTEVYFAEHDPKMIGPMRDRWDQIMAQPMAGHADWSWCDALFMAPPALARLSEATGDRKYLNCMDKQWWDTVDFLYDKTEHLFFRDKTYFDAKETNGNHVFWSRGNGWVLAGTARVLDFMPADYPDRDRYVQLFKQLAERVAGLQQSDGLWRMSLLDPDSTPDGETSGTGLFCYGLAWGINQGILPRDKYLPVVESAWAALSNSVEPSGKMEWVQMPGSKPGVIHKDDTAEYGVGALLLAGSEMIKLNGAHQ
jgi:unsaturated rhamnogalacturonyl hydrolase